MGWSNDFPTLFRRDIEAETKGMLERIEDYAYERVYALSPVDSGRYRSNHNRSRANPDYSTDWKKTRGKDKAPTGVKPFDVLYIANGLPYARRIEFHSWSHKAAGGVYQAALKAAKARFG